MASTIGPRVPGRDGVAELAELSRDLRAAAALADDKAKDIVKKAALNVKNDWQRLMRARSHHGHIPHLPPAVGYDIVEAGGEIIAVIGPDKQSRQGPLAHLLEFGSVNNPPHLDGAAALRAEAPRFYGAISKAEFLERRGGG